MWELHRRHGIDAAVVGMRKADPSGAWLKNPVTRCTEGWPPMTLFLPILDWDVTEVWDYTLARQVPYCSLYARGFTSLGSRHETAPNPALKDATSPNGFLPAWHLRDTDLERASRSSSAGSVRSSSHAASASAAVIAARATASPGSTAPATRESTPPASSSRL